MNVIYAVAGINVILSIIMLLIGLRTKSDRRKAVFLMALYFATTASSIVLRRNHLVSLTLASIFLTIGVALLIVFYPQLARKSPKM